MWWCNASLLHLTEMLQGPMWPCFSSLHPPPQSSDTRGHAVSLPLPIHQPSALAAHRAALRTDDSDTQTHHPLFQLSSRQIQTHSCRDLKWVTTMFTRVLQTGFLSRRQVYADVTMKELPQVSKNTNYKVVVLVSLPIGSGTQSRD